MKNLALSIVLLALAAAGAATAQPQEICWEDDFESVADGEDVGTIAGPVDAVFDAKWRGCIDSDEVVAGGCPTADEPTPEHTVETRSNNAVIDLASGVFQVELQYSTLSGFTIEAWDGPGATGNLIEADDAKVNNVAECTGDPTGTHCLWDSITVSSTEPAIRSVRIVEAVEEGVVHYFDDLSICAPEAVQAPTVPAVGLIVLLLLVATAGLFRLRSCSAR